MTRAEINAKLTDLGTRTMALAAQAIKAVESGQACTSTFFGDDSSCVAERGDAQTLFDRAVVLRNQFLAITLIPDAQLNAADIPGLESLARDYASEAKDLTSDAAAGSWRDFALTTISDLGAFIAALAVAVVTVVADIAGAATKGFFSELGPIGTAFVLWGLFELAKSKAS